MSNELTTAALVSGWIGYLSTAFSIAQYCPTVATNYAKKSNLVTPIFLYAWLVADVFSIWCMIMMKPRFVMYVYKIWVTTGDIVLFTQLQLYGSPAPFARNVFQGDVVLGRLSVLTASDSKRKWSERLKTWSDWDKFKTGLICLVFGTGMWAVFTLIQLISKATPVKTNSSTLILITGGTSASIFVVSRIFELYNGTFVLMPLYRKDRCVNGRIEMSKLTDLEQLKIRPPSISKDSVMFYFTIASNLCSSLSIVAYSTDMSYVGPQLPWVIGPLVNATLDFTLLMLATFWWWPNWRQTNTCKFIANRNTEMENEKEKITREIKIMEYKLSQDNIERYEQWHRNIISQLNNKIETLKSTNGRRATRKLHSARNEILRHEDAYRKVTNYWNTQVVK